MRLDLNGQRGFQLGLNLFIVDLNSLDIEGDRELIYSRNLINFISLLF